MYKLLIVDDEANIREGLSRFDWLSIGIELTGSCENGLEALQLIQEDPVDIVLTDIRMPLMGGLELAEQINRLYPFIKTVILTGYNDFDYVQTSLRNGVADYLLKPTTPEEISTTFKRIVTKLHLKKQNQLENLILQRKAQLSTKLVRSEFVNKLLFIPLSPEEIEEGCKAGELKLQSKYLSVSIIGLDNSVRKNYSIKDWGLILFAFDNALTEIWDEKGYGYHIIDPGTGKCCLLTGLDHHESIRILENIREQLYCFRGLFKTTLSIGIGTHVEISEISISCEQAEIALNKSNMAENLSVYQVSSHLEWDENPNMESGRHIIEAAKKYIKAHFRDSITLNQVANHVHVNPSYLSSLFKEVLGQNFIYYLTCCRIEEATQLLKDPKYKVYEIGERVGFKNAQYFSVIFKKYTGIAPHEFRSKRLEI